MLGPTLFSILLVFNGVDGAARPKHLCEIADLGTAVLAFAEPASELQPTEAGLATFLTSFLYLIDKGKAFTDRHSYNNTHKFSAYPALLYFAILIATNAAVCLKRSVVLPEVASKQWTELFTVKYFDMYMYSSFNTRAFLPGCVPSGLQTTPLTTEWCGPPPQNDTVVYLPELEEVARLDLKRQPELLAETLLSLLPAHSLGALVAVLLKKLGRVGFTCLHLCNQVSTASTLTVWCSSIVCSSADTCVSPLMCLIS
jgi:hypothetical protein